MTRTLRNSCFALLLLAAALAGEALAQAVGRIEYATGVVRIERGTQVLAGVRGTEVLEGDAVVTGPGTQVQLRMVDDAFIALRPNSRLSLERYRFNSANDGVVLSLAGGILRAFTGAIAQRNRDRFEMKTPLATVGIRGSGNILAHFATEGTVNHTIAGEHSVTATDAQGRTLTLVTRPGQTVQVPPGALPRFVPTPDYIYAAASSAPPAQVAAAAPAAAGGTTSSGSSSSTDSSSSSSSSGSGSSASGAPPAPPSGSSSTGTSTGTTTIPGGVATGTGTSISSTVQQGAGQNNLRAAGGAAGAGVDGSVSFAVDASLVHPLGRTNIVAFDVEPGFSSVRLDGNGFLTGATDVDFDDFLAGQVPYPSGYSPMHLKPSTLEITGGTAQDYFRNVEQTVVLGRWEGASLSATDGSNTRSGSAGPGSVSFAAYHETPLGIIHTLTGTTQFRLDGATRPADARGNLGTLNSATITADFTHAVLDFTFSLSVNNLTYTTTGSGVYFDRVRFAADTDGSTGPRLSVTCAGSGCAPQYGASIQGAFAGNAATAAWMGYQVFPERAPGAAYADLINGAIAFSAVTRPNVGIVLPATGTMTFMLIDNYVGTAPGFPTFGVSASAQADFTNRRADFSMTMNRILTPADVAAGYQAQSVNASAANLPIVGNLFVARIGDPRHPNTLNVQCTGCSSAAPVGRFEGFFTYVSPDQRDANIGIYWFLSNNTSGTLGYDYAGTAVFGPATAPIAANTAPLRVALPRGIAPRSPAFSPGRQIP